MIRVTNSISSTNVTSKERFVRASGSGEQNVNKVATAVELRFNVAASSLPPRLKRLPTVTDQLLQPIDPDCDFRGSPASSPQPVLNLQSGDPSELGDIVGDAHRIDGSRVRGNQHVVGANWRSFSLEGHTNRGIDAFDV